MGQYTNNTPAAEVDENLAKDLIQGTVAGRGIVDFKVSAHKCLCQRPYRHIICQNCGQLMYGRVRIRCPKHPMTTFLIDITNCPRCKCFEFMLKEFDVPEAEKLSKRTSD